MSQSDPSDVVWSAILRSPLKGFYLNELFSLADTIKRTSEGIFAKARPETNERTYLQVDHDLHRQIINVLSDAVKSRLYLQSVASEMSTAG